VSVTTIGRLDWLIAFNLLVNLVWLGFSARFAWTRPRWELIGLAATAGALLAAVPARWPGYTWLSGGWPTLLLAPLLVYVAVRPTSWKQYQRAMAGFMLFAAGAGGAVFLFSDWAGVIPRSGIALSTVTAGALIGAAGVHVVLQHGRVNQPVQQSLYPLRLCIDGQWSELTALLDSGHQLLTPVTRRPVAIVAMDQVRHLLPPEVIEAAAGGWEALQTVPPAWRNRCQLIGYQSLGQPDGMILAFAPDQISIQRKGSGEWIEVGGAIGLGVHPLQGEYQALIPPQMVGEAAQK